MAPLARNAPARGAGGLTLNAAHLYFRYVGISLRSQMEYRASVIWWTFGNFLITGIEFFAMWSLFNRFGRIEGFTLPEVALLYGMANLSFSLAEAIARGFDVFPQMVKSGDFDRLLLRPRSAAFQVLARNLHLTRVGRMAQAAVILGWAVSALGVEWTFAKAALLAASILGGACIFSALFVLQATLAFWTTESLEVMNTVTYGGVETAQYPLPVYEKWFRRFFTFVIPLACMNYLPSLAITGGPDPLGTPAWVPWVSPLAGLAFLGVAMKVWTLGVRRYRSTGS